METSELAEKYFFRWVRNERKEKDVWQRQMLCWGDIQSRPRAQQYIKRGSGYTEAKWGQEISHVLIFSTFARTRIPADQILFL